MNSNISIAKTMALLISCGLCGAVGGYYAAAFSPIPGQIAIVDVQAIIKKSVEKNEAKTAKDAQALTAKIKLATDELVKQGVVILDAQSVLSAPEEAYVYIE